MRILVVALAACFLPLAGCLGVGPAAVTGLFGAWDLPDGSPAPVPLPDCDAVLDTLNDRALAAAKVSLQQSVEGRGGWGPVMLEDAAADGGPVRASSHSSSAAEAQVTGTNNQEAGVDEADVLKTDGERTYVLRGPTLHILRSEHVGDVQEAARVSLDGDGVGLLLETRGNDDPRDDRLVVLTQTWSYEGGDGTRLWMPAGTAVTGIRVFALDDPAAPREVDRAEVEGSLVGARLVDGHAYVVVHRWEESLGLRTSAWPEAADLQRRGLDQESFHRLPEARQRQVRAGIALEADAANRQAVGRLSLDDHLPALRGLGLPEGCRGVLVTPGATGRGTSTIVALDVDGDLDSSVAQVLGSRPIVYGALDALVLAAPSRDTWWFWQNADVDESTDLQWFDLDGLRVTPRASGRVPGTVQDSFGIDVHDGTLRVATTTGQWARWWLDDADPMMNHLVVLEAAAGVLVPKGIVGGIAPGERIWSARFTDDRAYIVTFEQVDPLWVVDLGDPALPRILGELEIPGVSTYIHPLSDDALLTIGLGPGPGGEGLDRGRVQVSLFDVADPAAPRRAALLELAPGQGMAWSGAVHEHKAFTYWDALGMLAVPVTTEAHTRDTWTLHTSLRLVAVDVDAMTLSLHGMIDQSALGSDEPYGSEIERSYFLGYPGTPMVSVYAMSWLGVTAHDLRTLQGQGSAPFA